MAGCGLSSIGTGGGASAQSAVVEPATTAPSPTTMQEDPAPILRVFQEQRSCCYMEGQVSFLSVNGVEHEFRLARVGLVPLAELEVPSGTIEIKSWQRPCSGNCDYLDPPANRCSVSTEVEPGEVARLLVSFEPGPRPCQLSLLDEDPPTTVPLEYGFRSRLPSCGDDYTMESAQFGRTEPSAARSCFLSALVEGKPAELHAYEPSGPPAEGLGDRPEEGVLDLVVYRGRPGEPTEVFVNVGPDFEEWRLYRCNSVEPVAAPRLFVLEDCTDPEVLD
jgi:hypothetical protein